MSRIESELLVWWTSAPPSELFDHFSSVFLLEKINMEYGPFLAKLFYELYMNQADKRGPVYLEHQREGGEGGGQMGERINFASTGVLAGTHRCITLTGSKHFSISRCYSHIPESWNEPYHLSYNVIGAEIIDGWFPTIVSFRVVY